MTAGLLSRTQMQSTCPAIFISEELFEEGRIAQREGCVLDCQVDEDDMLTGKVRQNQSKPFAVVVKIKSDTTHGIVMEGHCTCRRSFNCEHVAAVIIEYLGAADVIKRMPHDFVNGAIAHPDNSDTQTKSGTQPRIIAAPVQSGPETPAVAEHPMPAELEKWLRLVRTQDFGADHAAAVPEISNREKRRFVYILSPAPDHFGQITVILGNAHVYKDGSVGNVRTFNPHQAMRNPPASVKAVDSSILSTLLACSPGTLDGLNTPFPYRLAADLVAAMVSTGRCYWRSVSSPPLKPGKPRPGTPCWLDGAKGIQIPGLSVQPTGEIVLGLQCLYIDTNTFEYGPIQLDWSPMRLTSWLSGPPVQPENVPALRRTLAELAFPAPREVRVEIRNDEVPVPILHLFSAQNPWYSERLSWKESEQYFHYAEFWVEYMGQRVKPGMGPEQMRLNMPDGVAVVRRRMDVERGFYTTLCQYDLRERNLTYYQGLQGNKASTVSFYNEGLSDPWKTFVQRGIPALELEGWRIEFDHSFRCRTVKVDDYFLETTATGDNNWFDLELGVEVEGERINILPLLRAALAMTDKKSKTIAIRLPDGRNISIPRKRLEGILGVLVELLDPAAQATGNKMRVDRLRAAQLSLIDNSWQWNGDDRLKLLGDKLRNFSGLSAIAPPGGLKAELRSYQRDGLNWLQFLREHDLSGVLADDMGLGKTVQTLAHIVCEKESGRMDRPTLVIAPTSVIHNWRAEAERFAPDLKTVLLHGPARHDLFAAIASHDLVLTTYPLLARDSEELRKTAFHLLIMDEAQVIKNPRTLYAQTARGIEARHRLCLSGTPLENHLGELWALYDFLLPGFLGDAKTFRRVFRDPIEKAGDTHRREALARRIGPLIMRRRKQEVALELPAKTEVVRTVEISGDQLDLYESIRAVMQTRVQDEIAGKGIARSHIVILDALLKLRQVCCDPRLVKLPSAASVRESSKLEYLMQMLPPMIEEGRKILLFSQFTGMLDLIEEEIVKREIDFVRLDGQTVDRTTPVGRFQAGGVPLFLISLKAGGTGLNLTEADTVIHYDPWWNPAVENQATDRAHRIGQTKPVFTYKLIMRGTVEEKIQAMQQRKSALVQGLLDAGAGAAAQLTPDDVRQLFAPLEQTDLP